MNKTITSDPKSQFLSNFIEQAVPAGNEYLRHIGHEAKSALMTLNVPSTRDESWKYTRISKILDKKFTQVPPGRFSKELNFWNIENAHLFVFINGFFSAGLSRIGKEKGAIISPLSRARKAHPEIIKKYFAKLSDHKKEFFAALNSVYHTNGVFVYLRENTVLKKPIHIVNIGASANAAFNPRNLFILEKNSSANIVSSYQTIQTGDKTARDFTLANVISEIFSEENSSLGFFVFQNENDSSFQVNTTCAELKSNSKADFFTITAGGNLVRNNLAVFLEGNNCEANLHGLFLCKNEQHTDNHTLVEHRKPLSLSRELYKGIMDDKSTGVFNGKVFVLRDAQKTNAFQSNQNILLGDEASVDSKPELEIYANDVKCSHGSATGQLDEDAVFYFRSRGISEKNARQLLLHAFAGEVVEQIKVEEVKSFAAALVEKAIG